MCVRRIGEILSFFVLRFQAGLCHIWPGLPEKRGKSEVRRQLTRDPTLPILRTWKGEKKTNHDKVTGQGKGECFSLSGP